MSAWLGKASEMDQKEHDRKVVRNGGRARYAVVLILIVLTTLYVRYLRGEEIALPEKVFQGFPREIGEWKGVADFSFSDEVINILKVSDCLGRTYGKRSRNVSLYIGYYNTHRKFAEIHTPENCLVGGGWEINSQKIRKLDLGEGRGKTISFMEAVYEKDRTKELFLYWYWVNGKHVTNFFHYKLNVIMNSILKNRSDAAFIRISVPVINDDFSEAATVGESFLLEILPVLSRVFS